MAKSMTVEMPGCPSCQLQCSDAATAPRGPSKGIRRGGVEQQRDCDEAAAKGIRRPDCANVQKAGSPCEQLAAKGIYRADCDPCIKPGAKGLARGDCDQVRKRPDVPVPSPGASRLAQAIDDCFKKGELTYYRPPRIGVARGTVSYEPASQTILYDPAFLDRQLPFIRASWLGNAFGAHVLNLEKQRFGTDRTPAESRRIRDYFAGYAARCLVADRVISSGRNHPVHNVRDSYERYLREGGFTVPGEAPRTDSDIGDWERGWISWDAGIVWSLQHDPTMPTSSASDPFRLTP